MPDTDKSKLGFTHDMLIMPFDHRGSFQEKLFGIKGRVPNAQETAEIASYKRIIYDGFVKAVKAGVPKDKAGILVDEQFGSDILKDAKAAGYMTACPAEKSNMVRSLAPISQNLAPPSSKFSFAITQMATKR